MGSDAYARVSAACSTATDAELQEALAGMDQEQQRKILAALQAAPVAAAPAEETGQAADQIFQDRKPIMSQPGDSGFTFDAAAKAKAFADVFDGGKPMWVKLHEDLMPALKSNKPKKILSCGDGPGEPGCFMANKFGCPTITSDVVPPMVESAKRRVEKQEGEGKLEKGQVTGMVMDMQDLSAIESGSIDLLTSAHAYPFNPDQKKALDEAFRVLEHGGIFGAVVWKSFELLPLAGALMGGVTGTPPQPPPVGSPPPPPMSWADQNVADKLLKESGFEIVSNSEETFPFQLTNYETAMKYCAFPIWDKINALESSGEVPDAWKKYESVWPQVCKDKGHLEVDEKGEFKGMHLKGQYRVVVARKP